jgi:hypothetical protein
MRETLAKRAGRPVSPQKTRPETMPLGSGARLAGVVWAEQVKERHRRQGMNIDDRKSVFLIVILMRIELSGRMFVNRFAAWNVLNGWLRKSYLSG